MAILIKGMEMPKPGQIVLVEIDENGDVFAAYDGGRTKLVQYKAVTVPPHGKLIDTDSWTFPTPHRNPSNDYMHGWNACLKSVHQQPTVIPASEEKEDTAKRDYEAAADYQQYCEMYEPTYDPDTGAM